MTRTMRGARFLSESEGGGGSWRGSRALARGELVGASVLQTPGGIQSEMAKVDTEIETFGAELEGAVHAAGAPVLKKSPAPGWDAIKHKLEVDATPPAITVQPIVRFYNDVWTPFATGWRSWYHAHDGWLHNFLWNEAPNAEGYQEKLAGMMAAATKLGMVVRSPAPDIESKSIADPRRKSPVDLAGDALDTVAKVAKYGLYGGLVLGGAFAVAKIVEVTKSSGSGKRK